MPFSNSTIASKNNKNIRKNCLSSDKNANFLQRGSFDSQSNDENAQNESKRKSVYRNTSTINSQFYNRNVHTSSPQYK